MYLCVVRHHCCEVAQSTFDWYQVGRGIDGETRGDLFGASLVMSADGTTMAVGAPYNNNNSTGQGHVRVYQKDTSDQQYKQIGPDIDVTSGLRIGKTLAISADGTTIAARVEIDFGGGSIFLIGFVRI